MQPLKWGFYRQILARIEQSIKRRNWSLIFSIGLVFFSVACAGSRNLSSEPQVPFKVIGAEVRPWISGLADFPNGIHLSFEISRGIESVDFSKVCYMQQSRDLISLEHAPDKFQASFVQNSSSTELWQESCKVPAHLENDTHQPDRAVVMYLHEGQEHYFSLRDIVIKPVLAYPGKQAP